MTVEPVAPQPVPAPKSVKFDQYEKLLADYKEAQASEDFWKKRKEAIRAQIESALGDAEEATIKGQLVLTWHRENRINASEFAARYPDLYKLYLKKEFKEVVDMAALKVSQPAIFAEVQVQSMRVTYDPNS